MPSDHEHQRPTRIDYALLTLAIVYTILVLGADTLAAFWATWPWKWSVLRWYPFKGHGVLSSFDGFKFLFWFLIPFFCCIRRMDWGAWGVKRWKRCDFILLAFLTLAGVGAMMLIPLVPSLSNLYGSGGSSMPRDQFITYVLLQLIWTFSWVLGWEFLHRYALLRTINPVWPRFGWLLVPLSEGLYHLQKPKEELIGMVVFSLVFTTYARRRNNFLLPLLAHLIIEIELILYMALFTQ